MSSEEVFESYSKAIENWRISLEKILGTTLCLNDLTIWQETLDLW